MFTVTPEGRDQIEQMTQPKATLPTAKSEKDNAFSVFKADCKKIKQRVPSPQMDLGNSGT